jgi:hypothetical protein
MSVVETLAVVRENIPNAKFLIVKGEPRLSGWSSKALGYAVEDSNFPTFSDEEIIAAVAKKQAVAVPTGEHSNWLADVEFDIYEILGSQAAADAWLAENLWRLESLGSIVVKSPRSGFHVWFFASSDTLDMETITDWLWIIEEDPRIRPDTIHFLSVNASDYCLLPPSPGYSFLGKCRTVKRFA